MHGRYIPCYNYCLLQSKKIDSVHSATFFTTLLDYTHPGELGIFFNEATINYIKEDIKLKGYFDG
ncbi:hypothetical protein O6R16_07115 [Candidatus Rickettsia tasmanensis]